MLSFTLAQVCCYFWQQRADANTHPSASSWWELPPPHCRLSIVPTHWVRLKSKRSLASSKLITDTESSRSSRWCATLRCGVSADLCCVGLAGWPPCWRGVRADCTPGFLHLRGCFGVMGRPAGGVAGEVSVSSTVGSSAIRPCCDGPWGRDESRWGVTAEIRWWQSSGVAVIKCSLSAQRDSLWCGFFELETASTFLNLRTVVSGCSYLKEGNLLDCPFMQTFTHFFFVVKLSS